MNMAMRTAALPEKIKKITGTREYSIDSMGESGLSSFTNIKVPVLHKIAPLGEGLRIIHHQARFNVLFSERHGMYTFLYNAGHVKNIVLYSEIERNIIKERLAER